MALDLSGRTDDEIRLLFAKFGRSPGLFENNPEYVAAVTREYHRRFNSQPAAGPPDVAAKLNAAAAPIMVEPTVGEAKPRNWRDLTDEEIVESPPPGVMMTAEDMPEYDRRYSEAHRRLVHSRADRRRASGVPDPDQAAYNAATGLGEPEAQSPRSSVTVDGVTVPSYLGSDGQPLGDGQFYTMRSVREAQDAADESRLSAMFSQSAQEDLAKYGTQNFYEYARDPATGALLTDAAGKPMAVENVPMRNDALAARRGAEQRQYSQNAALRANAAGNYDARMAAGRARYADMARLAGGSAGIRGGAGGNIGQLQALAMLAGVDPGRADARQQALMQNQPIDPRRAQIEAQNMANAGDVIKRFMTSGAAGALMDPATTEVARAAAELKMREQNPFGAGQQDVARGDVTTPQGQAVLDTLAEQHDTGGLGTMSWEDEDALATTLQKPPYNMPEAQAQAAAHGAAEKRRYYIWGARNNTRPSAASPTAPGAARPIN